MQIGFLKGHNFAGAGLGHPHALPDSRRNATMLKSCSTNGSEPRQISR
jgi:hypothetical protein